MSSLCHGLVGLGSDNVVIDSECHLSNNLPLIVIIGYAGRSVNESKDRLRGAFNSSQLSLPRKRITINLAPADVPKSDSGLDLAIAISILTAAGHIRQPSANYAAIGELSLDGTVRPVRGIIGKLLTGRQHGINRFFVPRSNLAQAQLVPGVHLYPVANLLELYNHLAAKQLITPVTTGDGLCDIAVSTSVGQPQLHEVVGQELAKRALTIAAAGGHNVFLSGPPGTGKSMLAQAMPSLLPPMSHEEVLEVTHLHSLASNDYDRLFLQRPFQSPHHSTSHVAMVGGGGILRPGAISLSHRGVLCLDEFAEFDRQTLEALRQPLEERSVRIARAKTMAQFPADFILVATANPCPCGYYGSASHDCRCGQAQLRRYQSKLSGPIMDRIDLWCDVHEVDHTQLLASPKPAPSASSSKVVQVARQRQAERYGGQLLNSTASNQVLRQTCQLTTAATTLLQTAASKLELSARGYLRVVKVARTIADLAASPTIEPPHMSEALNYRQRQPAANQPV